MTLEERFWSKVDTSAGTDACWPWVAARDPKGYGVFYLRGGMRFAHRVAFEMARGYAIPAGMQAMHSCDNPRCVNPRHISAGTPSQNTKDAYLRGLKTPSPQRGEKSSFAKLTTEDIRAIRADGSSTEVLAAAFGICESHVRRIRNRRAWAHVP